MIHAVITKKGSVPLDVEFPCDIEQLKEQLAERSIPPNLQGIRLTDDENAEISVKLSSDNDIGKRLIPLFSSSENLADLENVTFGVERIPTDFKDELEKNIMCEVYGSASELTADMKVMRYSAEYRNLSDSDLSSELDKTSQELFALSDNELEQVDYDARHKALWLEMDRRKQNHEPQEAESSVTYYPINEEAAKRAKEAISFSDYKPGSATAEYRRYVDEAAELAENQKKRVDPSYHAKIDRLLDRYARKMAENMNKGYEITARVPSVMIVGGGNFPVRKKEKQNAAAAKNMEEYRYIQGLLDKIRSTGMGGISSDDPNAIAKLESKLKSLEKAQETMKEVNAYYRKHKTLDGCPNLNAEQIERLKANMARSYRTDPKPYEGWALSNNNAEIHRIKERITSLTHKKEVGFTGWEFDGGRVEANSEDNRLRIFFDEKPDENIRTELKSKGFKWAPSVKAWQRQLNNNAIYTAKHMKFLQPMPEEHPAEPQEQPQDKKPDDPYERITVVGGEMSPQEQLAYLGMMKEKHPDWDIISMKLTIVDDDFVDIECEHKGTPFERIRRITGYLVGDLDRFNNAKKAEVLDRVRHTFDPQDFEDVYTDEEAPAMKIGGI